MLLWIQSHTNDMVHYGNPDKECTGIVVTCFAAVDVICKAAELGANLIIVHELFKANRTFNCSAIQSLKIIP